MVGSISRKSRGIQLTRFSGGLDKWRVRPLPMTIAGKAFPRKPFVRIDVGLTPALAAVGGSTHGAGDYDPQHDPLVKPPLYTGW